MGDEFQGVEGLGTNGKYQGEHCTKTSENWSQVNQSKTDVCTCSSIGLDIRIVWFMKYTLNKINENFASLTFLYLEIYDFSTATLKILLITKEIKKCLSTAAHALVSQKFYKSDGLREGYRYIYRFLTQDVKCKTKTFEIT